MKNKHSENQAVLLQRFGFTLMAATTVIWKAEDITFFTEAYFQPSKLQIFLNINIKQRWSSGGTRAKEFLLTGLAKQTNEWSEGHCDTVVPPKSQIHRSTGDPPFYIPTRSQWLLKHDLYYPERRAHSFLERNVYSIQLCSSGFPTSFEEEHWKDIFHYRKIKDKL